MKYSFTLMLALVASWLLWSGIYDLPFMLGLGAISCIISIWIATRMKIVDEEGAPAQLGIRPFIYAPWLAKEIVESNIEVTKIILSPELPMQRTMIEVGAHQETEIGRVILANSITLTPGTVSVSMQGDRILVHALSFEGAEEDLSGEMGRRVDRLEGRKS
jgi:multicomponent Na+:H+ antiporter subunit E